MKSRGILPLLSLNFRQRIMKSGLWLLRNKRLWILLTSYDHEELTSAKIFIVDTFKRALHASEWTGVYRLLLGTELWSGYS